MKFIEFLFLPHKSQPKPMYLNVITEKSYSCRFPDVSAFLSTLEHCVTLRKSQNIKFGHFIEKINFCPLERICCTKVKTEGNFQEETQKQLFAKRCALWNYLQFFAIAVVEQNLKFARTSHMEKSLNWRWGVLSRKSVTIILEVKLPQKFVLWKLKLDWLE